MVTPKYPMPLLCVTQFEEHYIEDLDTLNLGL